MKKKKQLSTKTTTISNGSQWKKRMLTLLKWLGIILLPLLANYYLQLSQNNFDFGLVNNFAFSWHTSKFMLSCAVLAVVLLFFLSLFGSISAGSLFFVVGIGILGVANYLKMYYRTEPIYPDDFGMIAEFSLLKDMAGTGVFVVCLLVIIGALIFAGFKLYKSFFLTKKKQLFRVSLLVLSSLLLLYVSGFNSGHNYLRKQYDKTALWIPYSQKMNYYNTGFVAGFLYNLKVAPMKEPENYSKETIEKIVKKYQLEAEDANGKIKSEEAPNVVFIMSESFSDPLSLSGIKATEDPIAAYRDIANGTYSGKMLSQNYGGGTANIEFEALTGFSMEPFNAQLTTPYTMLVPKKEKFPSIVSRLKNHGYGTTAIHPYNTSMYKRKDVYQVFGFDDFIDEDSMSYQETIANNPYISDESAFSEVLKVLKEEETPEFVHLVTMQTHMPYGDKYPNKTIKAAGDTNANSIANYMTDISYTSEALKEFLAQLETLDRRTLVVFWGDHLPSIYSDEFYGNHPEEEMLQTEFLLYDSENQLLDNSSNHLLSPFYFTNTLTKQAELKRSGFDILRDQLQEILPAFEKQHYFYRNTWTDEVRLSDSELAVYDDYQLIQYDIVSGKQYSIQSQFFDDNK